MDTVKIDITQLKAREEELHRATQKQSFYLRFSLQKFGQLRPLIVKKNSRGEYDVIDGSKLLKEMRYLGFTSVECKVLHEALCETTCWCHLNLLFLEVAEENVASMIHGLIKNKGLAYAQNNLPIDNDTVTHYYELFEFIWKEYMEDKKTNQMSLFS